MPSVTGEGEVRRIHHFQRTAQRGDTGSLVETEGVEPFAPGSGISPDNHVQVVPGHAECRQSRGNHA